MDVLTATIFVSLLLVAGGLVLFVSRLKSGDFEHGDRLSLLPLDDDDQVNETDNEDREPDDQEPITPNPGEEARHNHASHDSRDQARRLR